MPMRSSLHPRFHVATCHTSLQTLRWNDVRGHVPGASARTSLRGVMTPTDRGAHATEATAARVPSMTSPRPCATSASARARLGYGPPGCAVSPARRAASPARWAARSGPASGGAGGGGRPRGPRHGNAHEQARVQRMHALTPRVSRDQPRRGGSRRGDAARAVAARHARQAGAMRTKTGRPCGRGATPRSVVLPATRACPVTTGPQAADRAGHPGRRLDTAAARRARALQGDGPDDGPHPKQASARGDGPAPRAECLWSWLTPSWRVCRGVSPCHRPGAGGCCQCRRHVRHRKACEPAAGLLQAAFDPAMARRAQQGALVTGVAEPVDRLPTAINCANHHRLSYRGYFKPTYAPS